MVWRSYLSKKCESAINDRSLLKMRILDIESGKTLDNVCLYLTSSEAKDVMSSIKNLLSRKIEHHAHINDDTYQHEVTVTIYNEDDLEGFDERSKKLIREDK
jgi:hypothetical protein